MGIQVFKIGVFTAQLALRKFLKVVKGTECKLSNGLFQSLKIFTRDYSVTRCKVLPKQLLSCEGIPGILYRRVDSFAVSFFDFLKDMDGHKDYLNAVAFSVAPFTQFTNRVCKLSPPLWIVRHPGSKVPSVIERRLHPKSVVKIF